MSRLLVSGWAASLAFLVAGCHPQQPAFFFEDGDLSHYVDVATPFLWEDGTVMEDIFVEDNLHLNDMGNLIWGATIRAALMPPRPSGYFSRYLR